VSPAGGRRPAPWPITPQQEDSMLGSLSLQPVVALIAGILILVMPRLLNYVVAIYLIVIGVLGLMHR
jgi:threonine/homoserine efflux transporter RhtA